MYFKYSETQIHKLAPDCTRHVLARTDNLLICRLDMEKGHTAPLHHHPHEQCTYIISGKVEITHGDEKQVLSSGDSVSFQSDVPHTYYCLEDSVALETFTPMRDDIINFNK